MFFVSGEKGTETRIPWEIKQPRGSGRNNINNQFNEASGQSDRLIIDVSVSPFAFDEVCAKAQASLDRRTVFSECIVVDGKLLKHLRKR